MFWLPFFGWHLWQSAIKNCWKIAAASNFHGTWKIPFFPAVVSVFEPKTIHKTENILKDLESEISPRSFWITCGFCGLWVVGTFIYTWDQWELYINLHVNSWLIDFCGKFVGKLTIHWSYGKPPLGSFNHKAHWDFKGGPVLGSISALNNSKKKGSSAMWNLKLQGFHLNPDKKTTSTPWNLADFYILLICLA